MLEILTMFRHYCAAKCHILRPKCSKFDFGWGSAPWTPLRELTALLQTSWMKGVLLLRGGGGDGKGREGEGKKERRGGIRSGKFFCLKAFCKGKKVKTSIYIARLMHQAPLTRTSLKLGRQTAVLGHRAKPANTAPAVTQ